MDASTAAVDLVIRFEGRRLAAYKDPSGVPTIGFGTTVYPDGDRVRLGDAISASEAREYLAFDCARFARGVSALVAGLGLSQNQFDALVSFTYNVGLGAFEDSTMLKLLRRKKFRAAADEFPRWDKATVKGVKKVLPGLVKRRAAERALFLAAAGAAHAPVGPPPEPVPTVATVYADGGATVVALTAADGTVTDLLALADDAPATMSAVLRQYPTLTRTVVAAAGTAVPAGERLAFSAAPVPVPPVAAAPVLNRPLLALGTVDDAKHPGRDVHELQARLRDLGYYRGPVSGTFDRATDLAAKAFQADWFGPGEDDGRVGPLTWAKLFPVAKASKPAAEAAAKPKGKPKAKGAAHKSHLRLTKTGRTDGGLRLLKLTYVKDGAAVGSIDVYSGARGHQAFHTGPKSRAGSLEPLPEGRWFVHDIEWKDGRDNYGGKVWNSGLGPAKIRLDYKGPDRTDRGAIEIHIDWNRRRSPGTAGCVGIRNVPDYRTLVGWLRDTDPRDLFVDWGLGTCPAH